MKTRDQIITEVLAAYRRHASHHQEMAFKFALKSMQDAMLFQLAQDLGVSLEPTPKADVFNFIFPNGPKIDFDAHNKSDEARS